MPLGDDGRFRMIRWMLRHWVSPAHGLSSGICESCRCGWKQAKEDFGQKQPSQRETPQLVLPPVAACVPITTTIIVFSRDWLLTILVLVVLPAFLWWALLVPLRNAPSFLRRVFKIVVMSCIVFDAALVVWWLNFHAPKRFRIGGSTAVVMELFILLVWWVLFFGILLSRPKHRVGIARAMTPQLYERSAAREKSAPELHLPKVCFADVGGMEEAKQQIRDLIESRLNPQKYAAYGINRNGILLYGPRGSGKTFLAEATAGEFELNFHYVSPTKFITTWVGESEASIRGVFMRALGTRPALLFIDEIDALGSVRQNLGGGGDPGGAGRSYNNMAIELMQSIDQARTEPGFVLMAATNVIEGLDEALIREGRFDVKIRVDLPDEATREKIFEAQLSAKPCERFDLSEYARRTPGASAAKIRLLADQAAVFAARENRKIEPQDLERALEEYGGRDRPLFQPVEWGNVVLDERVERELRGLIRLVSNPFRAARMGLRAPIGLLLLGPPGTGKTMIARLIATQSKRSFLPVTSAEITDPKAVSRVFVRAKETSPSLIFLDEMDSVLPANPGYLNQYHVQIVEQFLIEIGALQPEHNVFLVGTTNHPENIDPRVLRGGRFSEKIEIGPPGRREINRLLAKYLEGVELEPSAGLDYLTEWLTGSTPADLEAMVATAKRYAFERSNGDQLAPLSRQDFARAAERVMGQSPPLRSDRSMRA